MKNKTLITISILLINLSCSDNDKPLPSQKPNAQYKYCRTPENELYMGDLNGEKLEVMQFNHTKCVEYVDLRPFEGGCFSGKLNNNEYSNKPCKEDASIILTCEIDSYKIRTYFTHIEAIEGSSKEETIQRLKEMCNRHGSILEK